MNFNLGSTLQNLFTGPGTPLDALFGTGGSPGLFSNPTGAWDQFKNGQTNVVNKQIADDNLEYQRELQEYQKALQQQIFEREDTAYQRTAADMAAAGINPLMMKQTNGAGAEVPMTPLHNDFQMQDTGVLSALSPLLSLADTVNGAKTGEYQRDALALQNDKQYLENYKLAHSMGLDYGILSTSKVNRNTMNIRNEVVDGNPISSIYSSLGSNPDYTSSQGNYFRTESHKKEELDFKNNNKLFDYPSNLYNNLRLAGSDDIYNSAEKALTKIADLYDNSMDNLFENKDKSISELGKGKKGFFNPANFILNLFGFNAQ